MTSESSAILQIRQSAIDTITNRGVGSSQKLGGQHLEIDHKNQVFGVKKMSKILPNIEQKGNSREIE